MKSPPMTKRGERTKHIRPKLHCSEKQIIKEITKPRIDSQRMEIVSVVSPFSCVISSWIMFVRTPVALSLLSNHPTCLLKRLSKNFTLIVKVRFSPPIPKKYFYRKLKIKIPNTKIANPIVHKFLYLRYSSRLSVPCIKVKVILDTKNPNIGN